MLRKDTSAAEFHRARRVLRASCANPTILASPIVGKSEGEVCETRTCKSQRALQGKGMRKMKPAHWDQQLYGRVPKKRALAAGTLSNQKTKRRE